MNKRIEITDELLEISPFLAGLDAMNVFAVPEGYFSTISDTVLQCIRTANNEIHKVNTVEANDVPANYFDDLSNNILAKIKQQENLSASNELEEISPLLTSIGKANPFEIPAHYFESFSADVFTRLDAETLPAFLTEAKGLKTFEVPQGYFENLPENILSKTSQQQGAKVVTLGKRSNWMKFAAAAMITGALALGVVKYGNKPIDATPVLTAQLDPIIEMGKSMDDKKFDETLNNLSEEDIVKYLEKNSNDADLATLTSSVEANDLPNEEDYLLDDATLDNFLKELDTKHLEN